MLFRSALVPIIESLPEGEQQFAVDIAVSSLENGEKKDPIQFGKDMALYNKTLGKLKSEKMKVRKEAAVSLIMQAYDAKGKTIDADKAKNAMSKMLDDLGISEEQFLQLPQDTISKVIAFDIQAKGLTKSANELERLGNAAMKLGSVNEASGYYAAAAAMRKKAEDKKIGRAHV